VAATVAELNGNITKAEVNTTGEGDASISLEITIRDINHLNEIIRRIAKLRDIHSVERS